MIIVINIVLYFAGTLAVIAIIFGGGQYIFSFGTEQAESGKKTIMWAVIGLITIMLSYAIVQNVVELVLSGEPTIESETTEDGGDDY